MNNKEIEEELRKTFKSATLPSRIVFEIEQNTLSVEMCKAGILANMQEDNSAFEGWILVLMTFFNKIENVTLSWKSPDENENSGHYHRFLYRVIKFREKFKWFAISACNEKETVEFTQKYLIERDLLLLNYPKSEAKDVPESNRESYIERKFKESPEFKQNFQLQYIEHQLPVGVFYKEIGKGKNVFTGGKSGIDLWGIKGNDLFIFELKFQNKKVGILSEMLLYLWIMEDVFINKKITYPFLSQKELSKTFRSFDIIYKKANEDAGVIKINGVLLADEFHVLVNENLINFVNDHFKAHSFPLEIMKQKYSIDSKINIF